MEVEMFGKENSVEDTHGEFSESYIAYATDATIREHSTSGGVISGIALNLLEKGEIDGVVTIVSDEKVLWRGAPQMARNRDDIIRSMKSKYAIAPTNVLLSEIREVPGRYLVVGLPCQIHGIIKARALDSKLRERIVLTIGLFCHAAIEHDAYEVIWETLQEKLGHETVSSATRFISRVGKHPGAPNLQLADGSLSPIYFGDKKGFQPSSMEMINILYRLYTPSRCLTCFDATAEFADIAVGDPWMAPPEDDVNFYQGWSFVLIRTPLGAKIFHQAESDKIIISKSVTRREALVSNRLMATEKRWRAFRVIETLRRQGKPIPEYHIAFPKASSTWEFFKTEGHMFTHIFCYLPKWRKTILKMMLGEIGYMLLRINNWRRSWRFMRRDLLSWIRRKSIGRT
jgi:coenzyme F420 hydrogenase subunit beta